MNFSQNYIQVLAGIEAQKHGLALCLDKVVMAVLVTSDGNHYFGFNLIGQTPKLCPRTGYMRGHGYELCQSVCAAGPHAEINAISEFDAHEALGTKARLYVYGVNHICQSCQEVLAMRPEISYCLVR